MNTERVGLCSIQTRPLLLCPGAGQQRFRTSDLGKYWEQMDHLQTMLDPLQGEALGAVVHSLRAVGVRGAYNC